MTVTGNAKNPNFIIIVADDLGFTDLGCFGGEIETPYLDQLANGGFRFTGFHTASACSPTRSMLLSGTDNHLAGLGQMAEFKRRYYSKELDGKPGYEGYLNYKVAALPEIVSPEYYTFISGKWHLGLEKPYWPSDRGFERSFTLLPGAGNHFKCKLDSKEVLPWIYQENGETVDPEGFPADFYSTTYFTDKFLHYLKEHETRRERPFLGLLTYTAPHWPLQAPPETIAKYKGKYNGGPLVLRKQRLEKARDLGLVPPHVVAHLVETQRDKTWDELDEESKLYESRVMEVYAAMVDELDNNVGKILKYLEATEELDNTVIMFMSDNGAEGMLMEALPANGSSFKERITAGYDNNFDNIGKKDSFVYYGDLWAQAATAPRYMYKMWATEGGINCPLILHAPQLAKNWERGQIINQFTTVMDILPTVLELANIPHPGIEFQGRSVHKPRGISWVTYLNKNSEQVYDDTKVTGWELFGQRAIRQGPYKAVYIPPPCGSGRWSLFNIDKDPGETTDLKEEFSEILDKLVDHWAIYQAETGLIELDEGGFSDGNYQRTIINDI